jgi:hypothetical protein
LGFAHAGIYFCFPLEILDERLCGVVFGNYPMLNIFSGRKSTSWAKKTESTGGSRCVDPEYRGILFNGYGVFGYRMMADASEESNA